MSRGRASSHETVLGPIESHWERDDATTSCTPRHCPDRCHRPHAGRHHSRRRKPASAPIRKREYHAAMTTHSATSTRPRIVPNAFVLLSNWRYLEYSILRIIAGWGRNAGDWEDKLAVCYHTWLQAQIVDRFRKRLDMYPGGKPDAPVNAVFERIVNAVLLAPSWPDAMAGVHDVLNAAARRGRTATTSRPRTRCTTARRSNCCARRSSCKRQQRAVVRGFSQPPSARDRQGLPRSGSRRSLRALNGRLDRVVEPGDRSRRRVRRRDRFPHDDHARPREELGQGAQRHPAASSATGTTASKRGGCSS